MATLEIEFRVVVSESASNLCWSLDNAEEGMGGEGQVMRQMVATLDLLCRDREPEVQALAIDALGEVYALQGANPTACTRLQSLFDSIAASGPEVSPPTTCLDRTALPTSPLLQNCLVCAPRKCADPLKGVLTIGLHSALQRKNGLYSTNSFTGIQSVWGVV